MESLSGELYWADVCDVSCDDFLLSFSRRMRGRTLRKQFCKINKNILFALS